MSRGGPEAAHSLAEAVLKKLGGRHPVVKFKARRCAGGGGERGQGRPLAPPTAQLTHLPFAFLPPSPLPGQLLSSFLL